MTKSKKRKYVIKNKDRKPWSEEAKKAQSIRVKELWRVRNLKKKQKSVELQVKAAKVHMNLVKKKEGRPIWKRIIDAILDR